MTSVFWRGGGAWLNAPVLKTGRGGNVPRGFESHPLRHKSSLLPYPPDSCPVF